MVNINITKRNTDLSEKLKNKIHEKITKHERLLTEATNIQVIVSKLKSNVNKEIYELSITIKLPKAYIKVKEIGDNISDMIDKADSILFRRLKRYHELKRKWEGEENWKNIINESYYEQYDNFEDFDEYRDFEPIISKRETYEDDTPRHPAEAIELMELLGRTSFLFKNIETGKHSMVYKLKNGTYALVEPPSL